MKTESPHPVLQQQDLQARFGLHDLWHQEERPAGEAGPLLGADLQQPLHEGLDPPQHDVGLQRLVQQVEEHALPGAGREAGVHQLPVGGGGTFRCSSVLNLHSDPSELLVLCICTFNIFWSSSIFYSNRIQDCRIPVWVTNNELMTERDTTKP